MGINIHGGTNCIINRKNPLSFLQQRLNYAEKLKNPLIYMVENVPGWPQNEMFELPSFKQAFRSYENCQGNTDLLDALCERETEKYGMTDLKSANVLVINGAFHGLTLLAKSLFRPGDSVLCQAPVLASVEKILRLSGYEIRYFTPSPDESIAETIRDFCERDKSIRLLYLNVPHNPSGMVLAEKEMQDIAEMVMTQGLHLVMDMVYDSYVFGQHSVTLPDICVKDWENIYVLNSMSKNYGAPGLRIGWMISAEENILELTGRLEAECIAVSTEAQYQAIALLERGNAGLVQNVAKNWLVAGRCLNNLPGIDFTMPSGGTQYFPAIPVEDVEYFADFMLLEFGVVLVTGSNYVGTDKNHIRIPIGSAVPGFLEHAVGKLVVGLEAWMEMHRYHKISA